MTAINSGEVWLVDFGLAAKVRPALLLTANPAADALDLVTVLLHTTSLRGNRWELSILKPFLNPGTFHFAANQKYSNWEIGTSEGRSYRSKSGVGCVGGSVRCLIYTSREEISFSLHQKRPGAESRRRGSKCFHRVCRARRSY